METAEKQRTIITIKHYSPLEIFKTKLNKKKIKLETPKQSIITIQKEDFTSLQKNKVKKATYNNSKIEEEYIRIKKLSERLKKEQLDNSQQLKKMIIMNRLKKENDILFNKYLTIDYNKDENNLFDLKKEKYYLKNFDLISEDLKKKAQYEYSLSLLKEKNSNINDYINQEIKKDNFKMFFDNKDIEDNGNNGDYGDKNDFNINDYGNKDGNNDVDKNENDDDTSFILDYNDYRRSSSVVEIKRMYAANEDKTNENNEKKENNGNNRNNGGSNLISIDNKNKDGEFNFESYLDSKRSRMSDISKNINSLNMARIMSSNSNKKAIKNTNIISNDKNNNINTYKYMLSTEKRANTKVNKRDSNKKDKKDNRISKINNKISSNKEFLTKKQKIKTYSFEKLVNKLIRSKLRVLQHKILRLRVLKGHLKGRLDIILKQLHYYKSVTEEDLEFLIWSSNSKKSRVSQFSINKSMSNFNINLNIKNNKRNSISSHTLKADSQVSMTSNKDYNSINSYNTKNSNSINNNIKNVNSINNINNNSNYFYLKNKEKDASKPYIKINLNSLSLINRSLYESYLVSNVIKNADLFVLDKTEAKNFENILLDRIYNNSNTKRKLEKEIAYKLNQIIKKSKNDKISYKIRKQLNSEVTNLEQGGKKIKKKNVRRSGISIREDVNSLLKLNDINDIINYNKKVSKDIDFFEESIKKIKEKHSVMNEEEENCNEEEDAIDANKKSIGIINYSNNLKNLNANKNSNNNSNNKSTSLKHNSNDNFDAKNSQNTSDKSIKQFIRLNTIYNKRKEINQRTISENKGANINLKMFKTGRENPITDLKSNIQLKHELKNKELKEKKGIDLSMEKKIKEEINKITVSAQNINNNKQRKTENKGKKTKNKGFNDKKNIINDKHLISDKSKYIDNMLINSELFNKAVGKYERSLMKNSQNDAVNSHINRSNGEKKMKKSSSKSNKSNISESSNKCNNNKSKCIKKIKHRLLFNRNHFMRSYSNLNSNFNSSHNDDSLVTNDNISNNNISDSNRLVIKYSTKKNIPKENDNIIDSQDIKDIKDMSTDTANPINFNHSNNDIANQNKKSILKSISKANINIFPSNIKEKLNFTNKISFCRLPNNNENSNADNDIRKIEISKFNSNINDVNDVKDLNKTSNKENLDDSKRKKTNNTNFTRITNNTNSYSNKFSIASSNKTGMNKFQARLRSFDMSLNNSKNNKTNSKNKIKINTSHLPIISTRNNESNYNNNINNSHINNHSSKTKTITFNKTKTQLRNKLISEQENYFLNVMENNKTYNTVNINKNKNSICCINDINSFHSTNVFKNTFIAKLETKMSKKHYDLNGIEESKFEKDNFYSKNKSYNFNLRKNNMSVIEYEKERRNRVFDIPFKYRLKIITKTQSDMDNLKEEFELNKNRSAYVT